MKGTKEALDALRAYIASSLAEAIRPTVERILAAARPPHLVLNDLRGEFFLDDISAFVEGEVEELVSYRNLEHARIRWSAWSQRISWAIYTLLIIQGVFTLYFAVIVNVFGLSTPLVALLITVAISAAVAGACLFCAGAMLYYHDEIAKYRNKIL